MGIVRKRILLLLCAVAVLFALGIAGWQFQEQRRLSQSYRHASVETCRTADKLVDMRGEKLANLADDYTFWDEMADFVKTRDPKWAEVNLVTAMDTFGAGTIAVYNPSGVKVYSCESVKNASLLLSDFGPQQIKRLFSAGPLCHFFLQTRRGLLEVRGAKIVLSADAKRTGPTRGYFLTSQIWDSSYLNGVATLLDGKASLQPASAGIGTVPGEKEQRAIVFRKPLPGPGGRTVRTLCVTQRFTEGDLQRAATRRTLSLMGTFALLMTAVLFLGLSQFVGRPLGLISNAMETQSPDTLSPLERDSSEFGRLATLIRQFFHQRVALVEESRVRACAEQDSRKSEQRLSTTLNSIGDAVIATNAEGCVARMNPVAEWLTGWLLSEAIGRPISEVINIVNAITGEPAPIPVEEVLSTGEVRYLANHTTLISRDGTRRQIADSAAPIRDDSGAITGVVLVFSDVTEQYRVREELRESEESLSATLNSISDGFYSLDDNLVFTYFNTAAETMLRRSRADVIGKGIFEVFPKLNGSDFDSNFTLAVKNKSGMNFETPGTTDGHWYDVRVYPQTIGISVYFRDITERRQAEEALQASSAKLDFALTSAGMGVWQWDITRDKRTFDEQTCRLLGIDPATFGGTAEEFFASVHLDDREVLKRNLARTIKHDAPYAPEYRTIWPDGSIHYVCTRGRLVRDEAGLPTRITGVIWDITERKQAEEALHESEDRFRQLVQNGIFGVAVHEIILDEHGKPVDYLYLQVNPAFETHTGLAAGDVEGRRATEVFPGHQGAPFIETYGKVALTGEPIVFEEFVETLHRHYHVSAYQMGPGRFATVFMDITERKRVEVELRESQQMTEDIINAIAVRVFWKDRNLVYLGCNTAFARDAGFADPKDIIGKDDYQMGWSDQAELYRADDRRTIDSGNPKSLIEEPQTTPEGDIITLLTSKIPMRSSTGEITGVLGTYVDISDRKRMEEVLQDGEARALRQRLALADLVGSDAIESGDAEAATRILTEVTSSVLQVNRSSIWMLSAEGKELVCVGLFDAVSGTHSRGHILSCEDYPRYFEAIQSENRIPAEDARTDPRTDEFAQNYLIPLGITSLLDVGITLQGKLTGVLSLEHIGPRRQWHADEESFASTIATLMTQAMANRSRKQAETELFDAKVELENTNSLLVDALTQANLLTCQAELAKEQIEEHAVELSHQASHDALTGLPNRKYFGQHLSDLITGNGGSKSRSMVVLFLDLDKFKLINDTLGHKVGDLLLVEVAERLQSCLRSGDFLARMGGDEFTVILPRCNRRPIAQLVASRMIDSISRPFDIQGSKFVIGASIGLASYPSDGKDTVSLLKHADAAMYRAKQAGRGTFRWFTGDVDVDNQQRADMEMDIRAAVENDQFEVYYQPIVGLEDSNTIAAEALLRWEHPEKGMISPSLFIPIAEEIGLIGRIGDYVLRTACAQTMAWRKEGIHLSHIAVNVSTRQVREESWLDSVGAALSDTGLDAQCLDLELTETDFATDYESMKNTLQQVQELGIGLAIDDFGIGQSSLSRLKDFPVIHLKIDGSFVRDIEYNKSDNALVRSIVEMAHAQGIRVTAEWVETESQMEILRSIGCDFAQGYYFSPALSSEAFGDFVQEWKLNLRQAAA